MMPLVRVDMLKGREKDEIVQILDAIHRAIVACFRVPVRDRYQLVYEHDRSHMVMLDTGLGLERSDAALMISVTSRARADTDKIRFYSSVCHELKQACGIDENDIMVSFSLNGDADWSFGRGRAQFITGEL
jgi:hypothetical protein